MYERNAYLKTIWVPVPDPANPPVDAEALVSENLNNIENGITGNRESLHSSIVPLNSNEFLPISPVDDYPNSMVLGQSVTLDIWGFDGFLITYKPSDTAGIQTLYPLDSGVKVRRSQAPSRPVWKPTTFYAAGQEVQPTTGNGYYFVVTAPGESGTLEPVWNTAGPTTDNTVTWDVGSAFWYPWENYEPYIVNQFVSYDNPVTTGTRVSTPVSQTLTSATGSSTNTLLSSAEFVQLTSPEVTTVNSTPTVADGANGQLLNFVNIGDFNITLQSETATLASNLYLSAATVTLAPRASIRLIYLNSEGGWVQI